MKNYTTDTAQTMDIFDGDLKRPFQMHGADTWLSTEAFIFMGVPRVLKTGQPAASRGSRLKISPPNETTELAHTIATHMETNHKKPMADYHPGKGADDNNGCESFNHTVFAERPPRASWNTACFHTNQWDLSHHGSEI
jgi:hypothetical protein